MEREVIVVGAGPSGASAATAMAQRGRDVLLIDRARFPRDKTCGDGIPASAIEILYSLGMKDKVLASNFYEIQRVLLSSPSGYTLVAPIKQAKNGGHTYVIPRMQFDALIQEHAVESGVSFLEGHVTGPIIENGRVIGVKVKSGGTEEEILAKVVIGADGVTSSIARVLRPDKQEDKHRAVALRAYIEDIEELPRIAEFYLYNEILPGYAWIFPLGEGKANIGLGMRLDKYREAGTSLEELLDIFLNMPAIKGRLHQGGRMEGVAIWQLNFGSQHMQRAYDGAILIGDAAGLINPLTGGGITNGVQSAVIAADVVDKAFSTGDFSLKVLNEYDQRLSDRLNSGMRRSYLIQQSLNYFPRWVDWVVRWGGNNSMVAKTFIEKL
ncbi:MAG: NAD(P)/FAD-dependent oxidoreductase [Candidatus Promineifilaceae bacterium]